MLYNYVENMSKDHSAADGFSDDDALHTSKGYAVLHDYALIPRGQSLSFC